MNRSLEEVVAGVLMTITTETYPIMAPLDHALPALIYTRVNTTPHIDLDDEDDSGRALFRIDCYARTISAAKATAKSVRVAFRNFTSDEVQSVTLRNEFSMIDQSTPVRLYRVSLDFDVFGDV